MLSSNMELRKTNKSKGKYVTQGFMMPVNTAMDGVCVTLTTRYEDMGINDILTLAHFPRTVILLKYEI